MRQHIRRIIRRAPVPTFAAHLLAHWGLIYTKMKLLYCTVSPTGREVDVCLRDFLGTPPDYVYCRIGGGMKRWSTIMSLLATPTTNHAPAIQRLRTVLVVQNSLGSTTSGSDTCCIAKNSNAELSEAINSMYQWYKDARICIAYLDDVPWTRRLNCRKAVGSSGAGRCRSC